MQLVRLFEVFSLLSSAAYAAPQGSSPSPSPGLHHGEPIPLTVDLGYSKYQGEASADGVNQYLGMRFAAPPLGDLRWRAPADPVFNKTVQPATAFGPTCEIVGYTFPILSEDCLFINVFAPTNATARSKLPVWFFISGGGYSGLSNANYRGTDVIPASNHSIILVNFNYRVGAFGFLASEKIRQDGSLNVGLLDQRKALEWVQKYIHLFGGDPNHVVIHGDSSGAGSVAHHLTWAGGRNDHLFVGAISQSPFFPTERTVSEMEFQFDRFAQGAGCDANSSEVMQCLRSKDVATLQTADVMSPFPGGQGPPLFYFLPVIDGVINQELMYSQFERGQIVRVPTMVGDDTTEGGSFAPDVTSNAQFLQFFTNNFPRLTQRDLREINASYPLTPPRGAHPAWFGPAADAFGDAVFICAGNEIANSLATFSSPYKTWSYEYDVPEPNADPGNPVPHTIEMPAVFGPDAVGCEASLCSYAEGQPNYPMVPIVMNYYISFVRVLDPNPYRLPSTAEWQPWGHGGGRDQNRLKFVAYSTHMETVSRLQVQRCDLWKRLAPDMEQ